MGGWEGDELLLTPSFALHVQAVSAAQQLRVMIAGAPAAGKGTQCANIVEKASLWCSVEPNSRAAV